MGTSEFGETRVSKLLQVAGSDIGIAAAHYNFGEVHDAVHRIELAQSILSTAKARILLEVAEKQTT